MPVALRMQRPQPYRWEIEFDHPGQEVSIGVVVPFDFSLDWEYWKYLPPEVELHFTRTPHVNGQVGVALAKALWRPTVAVKATKSLLPVNPRVVLYACSSGSFVKGVAGERELRAAMAETGVPRVVTSSSAMVDALRMTGRQKVAVVSPYTERLTSLLVDFLEEAELDVTSANFLGLNRGMSTVSKATIADLVHQADDDTEAEAVFVSCTALRTYGIVAQLERELERPVFTANQVSLWAALLAAGALPRTRTDAEPEWVMGDADPVARSTRLLISAAQQTVEHGAA